MIKPADRQAGLRLIQGGRQCRIRFGPIDIVTAPQSATPFEVDALAVEEDTWLIMSAEPTMGDLQEHPIRLMTDLIEARPKPVGSVVVQGRNPMHFMAIVHDVNQDPTCREEWVHSALHAIFREAEGPLCDNLHSGDRLDQHQAQICDRHCDLQISASRVADRTGADQR